MKAELGISQETRVVVFIYGGQPAGDWNLRAESLPAGWVCLVCAGGKLPGGKPLPANYILAPADIYTPNLVGVSGFPCELHSPGLSLACAALVMTRAAGHLLEPVQGPSK